MGKQYSKVRTITVWAIGVFGTAFSVYYAFFLASAMYNREDWIIAMIKNHPKLFVFIPAASCGAYAIVTLLEFRSGVIEFQVGDIKFKGAAGTIIFWILSFVSVASMVALM